MILYHRKSLLPSLCVKYRGLIGFVIVSCWPLFSSACCLIVKSSLQSTYLQSMVIVVFLFSSSIITRAHWVPGTCPVPDIFSIPDVKPPNIDKNPTCGPWSSASFISWTIFFFGDWLSWRGNCGAICRKNKTCEAKLMMWSISENLQICRGRVIRGGEAATIWMIRSWWSNNRRRNNLYDLNDQMIGRSEKEPSRWQFNDTFAVLRTEVW